MNAAVRLPTQRIRHDHAALTHRQIGRPSGAAHASDAHYQGLLEAEPELLP